MASLACDREGFARPSRDPPISSSCQTAKAPPVLGIAGLAPHIRALLPISGLAKKGREAGER
jgi:hypothetical protein